MQTGGAGNAGEDASETSPRPRRKRRSREDIAQRIQDAARDLFGERGYASATTKEIARRADVSETLLFRYYGDKATLFGEVVTAPFHRLMDKFTGRGAIAADQAPAVTTQLFTEEVFRLFEDNETLFRALLVDALVQGEAGKVPDMGGLNPFFDSSVAQMQERYRAAGQTPPFDLSIGVRLGFGMIVSSVLLRDLLFAGTPPRDRMLEALQYMIASTLVGPVPD